MTKKANWRQRFYEEYLAVYDQLTASIEGIESEADRRRYASLLMQRLVFIKMLHSAGLTEVDLEAMFKQWKEKKMDEQQAGWVPAQDVS